MMLWAAGHADPPKGRFHLLNIPEVPVCTENLIRLDEARESPKLTRWLCPYGCSQAIRD